MRRRDHGKYQLIFLNIFNNNLQDLCTFPDIYCFKQPYEVGMLSSFGLISFRNLDNPPKLLFHCVLV